MMATIPLLIGLALVAASRALQLKEEAALRNTKEPIHVTLLSDRVAGAAAALQSVCKNTADPARLHFHIIGPDIAKDRKGGWRLRKLAPACHKGRASVDLYPLKEMTARVESSGFRPAWLRNWASVARTSVSIHQAEWDNSTTHNDPFNILRFYLPHIEPFSKMSTVIFMDDDVVIQGDVVKAWEYELQGDAVISASCHNWVWSDCDRFESSTDLSYLEVPYLGLGRLSDDRLPEDAACVSEEDKECIPDGFLELLATESERINGAGREVTLERLSRTIAWNYGFNKFDLAAWRKHKITEKYEKWIDLNFKYNIFPVTSLSYGLGIPMLAKVGHVQCFDDVTPVIQGLGFVGPKDMRGAGHYFKELQSSFGMHFNGPRKPWDPSSGNPYSDFFLQYAQRKTKRVFKKRVEAYSIQKDSRARLNSTSFVVLTDPRSGSEWFMEMLDQHHEICASGEAEDGAAGFPREALIPARYGYVAAMKERAEEEEIAARSGNSEAPVSLLGMSGAVSRRMDRTLAQALHKSRHRSLVPKNYYTPSHPESNFLIEASKLKVGGFTACQMKAGCSWGFLASLVWRGAQDSDMCKVEDEAQRQHQERYGFGQHVSVVCNLLRLARRNLRTRRTRSPTPGELTQEAFHVYFRHHMRESLRLNDAKYGSDDEEHQVLPCRCPRSTLIVGQKVMHDWIGDLPKKGLAYADWKARPADVNYNAKEAAADLNAPYYDLIGVMQELGTVAILFERENLLARYVSLEVALQSKIYHCNDPRCVEAAKHQKVTVDVDALKRFIYLQRRNHQRTREKLADTGIPAMSLNYEECRSNTATCMDMVTTFLGVSPPSNDLAATTKSIRLTNSLHNQIINVDEVREALIETGDDAWLE